MTFNTFSNTHRNDKGLFGLNDKTIRYQRQFNCSLFFKKWIGIVLNKNSLYLILQPCPQRLPCYPSSWLCLEGFKPIIKSEMCTKQKIHTSDITWFCHIVQAGPNKHVCLTHWWLWGSSPSPRCGMAACSPWSGTCTARTSSASPPAAPADACPPSAAGKATKKTVKKISNWVRNDNSNFYPNIFLPVILASYCFSTYKKLSTVVFACTIYRGSQLRIHTFGRIESLNRCIY